MKYNVIYIENGKRENIEFEVADLDTCRIAVNQWRVNERRLKKRIIQIVDIIPIDK
jgi:hypothetical protein